MTNIAIRVENLSKMYRIGGPQEKYTTFRDVLARTAIAPFRRARDLWRGQAYGAAGLKEEIWALKDINFEVKHGEVVGIIGRNGAGKSTLLKILSRITEPTMGWVDVYGRVGALLEVGTGFHPELTGRENVYLNGAILGMSRRDIDRKFDEIIDFAGVERFIDTPVKHYSSGMGLRLGFAVAAHLEPEILVVDEVLAVGDAEFQKKCLGKMSDVAGEGRTVLFVSHNMGAVQSLCQWGLLLQDGTSQYFGPVSQALNRYMMQFEVVDKKTFFPRDTGKPLQILYVGVQESRGLSNDVFEVGETVNIEIQYAVHEQTLGSNVALLLRRNGLEVALTFDTDMHPVMLSKRPLGVHHYLLSIPTVYLKAGYYTADISVGLINKTTIESYHNALSFKLVETITDNSNRGYAEHRPGVIKLPVEWVNMVNDNA